MPSHLPPVPPAGRSDKGPGSAPEPNTVDRAATGHQPPANPDEQGQTANTRQNTTNQGYQQDR